MLASAAVCGLLTAVNPAFAQGTAFAYQGRLQNNGSPANGMYNLTFSLFTTGSGGAAIAGPVTNNGVFITNGLFTATMDFGSNVWNGATNWLQISVATNGVSSFSPLTPRQQLMPVPYAMFAESVGSFSGTVPSGALAGTYSSAITLNNAANSFIGNGAGLTGVNALTLGGFGSCNLPCYWNLTGNAGTMAGLNFVGTTDNQPLEMHVNNLRAMRYEFGGISAYAASLGYSVPNGAPNIIGGSPANAAAPGAVGVVIAGGGATNYLGLGSYTNCVSADFGVIGGGGGNQIQTGAFGSIVGGGFFNAVSGTNSSIAGGYSNFVASVGEFIGGGLQNSINPLSTGNGYGSTIGGGLNNTIQDGFPFFASSNYFIGRNTVGGGGGNIIRGGGDGGANGNTIAGGENNAIFSGAAGTGDNTISGGAQNIMGAPDGGASACVIGGGFGNLIAAGESYYACTIAGGYSNTIGDFLSVFEQCTVGGGANNFANGNGTTIAGGTGNTIQASGGNTLGSTISGGDTNLITDSDYASIGGGRGNAVAGDFATIPGGQNNLATNSAFAAGHRAKAVQTGSFVWADSTDRDYNPYSYSKPGGGTNSFNVRATGGVYLATAVDASTGQPTSGVYVSAGGSGWNSYSDRNAKTNFAAVNGSDILNRFATIPILSWNYKSQGPDVRHLGPMAQDFNAAFEVGDADKAGEKKFINSLDIDGVALAAIQGLNQKLDEKDAEIRQLKSQNETFEKRLAALEKLAKSPADQ